MFPCAFILGLAPLFVDTHTAGNELAPPNVSLPSASVQTADRGLFDTELFFAFPNEGEAFDLVFLAGMNFGDFPIPWFGFIPSVPVFTFNTPAIPGIGTFSFSITAVPIYLFGGTVDLTVDGARGRSDAIPFRLL